MRMLIFELFQVLVIFALMYGTYRIGKILILKWKAWFDKMDKTERKSK